MENSVWFSLVLGVGALQGIFLAVMLWRISNKDNHPNKKLAILLSMLSIALLGRFAYNSKVFAIVPQLFLVSDITMFLYGPIFYFYIREVLFGKAFVWTKNWWHFIPAILHFISMLVQCTISPERYLQMVHEAYPFLFRTWVLAEVLALIQLSIYLIICLRLALKHQWLSKNFFSFSPQSRYLLLCICIMFPGLILWWNNYLRYILGFKKLSIWLGFDAAWMSITVLHFIIAYYLISYPNLFVKMKAKFEPAPTPYLETNTPSPPSVDAMHIQKKLEQVMEKEQLFLEPALNLYQLASAINEPPHLVSRILNVHLKKNFFDFVNSYRIEAFIRLAKQKNYAHLTLLAIAFEVGFNSKTTFNKAFKKAKGIPPKQYLKTQTADTK